LTPYVFGKSKKVQVEYVIEKAYDKMTSYFSQDVEFAEHLWDQILLGTNNGGVVVPFENVTLDLFDEETENLFEEVKFRLDIARRQLVKLDPDIRSLKVNEAEKQLRHVLDVFEKNCSSTLMNIGGRTYNGDVWTPIYRLLAGIDTARGEVPEGLRKRVREVLFKDAFVHPMIAEFL